MIIRHLTRTALITVLLAMFTSLTAIHNAAAGDLPGQAGVYYDLIIANGRVIDPETGRDEIACIAVKNGVIQKIAAGPGFHSLQARRAVDAAGLVVSPGFINTHTHEGIAKESRDNISITSMLIVQDGITFWLGGNCGMSPTGVRVSAGEGLALSVGDPDRPLSEYLDEMERVPLYNNYATLSGNITLRSNMGLRHMEKESDEQIARMKEILARDLAAGSFGISFGVMYDMGTTKKSMDELARVSRQAGGMAASHTRYPTFNLKHLSLGIDNVVLKRSIYEAIDTCRVSGVPFIVSHITDMSQSDSSRWALKTLDQAIREDGLLLAGDIIGHDYLVNDFYILTFKGMIPVWFMLGLGNYKIGQFYAAQDVYLDGKLYAPKYRQFTLSKAEYLRRNIKRIAGYGKDPTGLPLICKIIPPEDTKLGLRYPWVFIGDDYGGGSIDPKTGEPVAEIPRALGTFTRLLGHWSRDEGAISLKQALFKATIAPALWLGLDKKGRLQEACDADIVIFDPDTIIDLGDWLDYKENLRPEGIAFVIVNGQVVVESGKLTGDKPGRLIRRSWKIPGDTAELLSLYQRRFNSN